jgi:hypothetical protein
MKVVRLSALRTGHRNPQEIFLVLISVRGRVDPTAKVRPEGQCTCTIAMKPTGIDPATFRFVAQYLNHYATACPPIWKVAAIILNNQSRTADRGGPTVRGLGERLTTLRRENVSLLRSTRIHRQSVGMICSPHPLLCG